MENFLMIDQRAAGEWNVAYFTLDTTNHVHLLVSLWKDWRNKKGENYDIIVHMFNTLPSCSALVHLYLQIGHVSIDLPCQRLLWTCRASNVNRIWCTSHLNSPFACISSCWSRENICRQIEFGYFNSKTLPKAALLRQMILQTSHACFIINSRGRSGWNFFWWFSRDWGVKRMSHSSHFTSPILWISRCRSEISISLNFVGEI